MATMVLALVLLVARRRRLAEAEIALLAVVLAGLLVNAAVCGVLSAIDDRYQGRVAWLLPAVVATVGLRLVTRKSRGAPSITTT